ncbi:hypothetical protein [Polaromonas sp.]|uniref:hypothetical protein n=1 Tax=Polaromonas sp. TaxID=1869339 RepID=UPI00356741E4
MVTTEQRSHIMHAAKRKNTAPEMVVRRTLHAGGYRYVLHFATLPGSPDVVIPKREKRFL